MGVSDKEELNRRDKDKQEEAGKVELNRLDKEQEVPDKEGLNRLGKEQEEAGKVELNRLDKEQEAAEDLLYWQNKWGKAEKKTDRHRTKRLSGLDQGKLLTMARQKNKENHCHNRWHQMDKFFYWHFHILQIP